ncbi:hypothetical protein GGD38_003872 [Chitinophagaceae bacterium OAS944]|nr:hypothetical protein [Chitinophagaceae bacterium OAS944]
MLIPDATVVLGGYDGLFNPPGYYFQFPDQEKSLQFFRQRHIHMLQQSHYSLNILQALLT